MNKTKLFSAVALSTAALGVPAAAKADTPVQPNNSPSDKIAANLSNKLRLNPVSITKIYNHQISGKSATTLYIRNIPFLTFVSESGQNNSEIRANQIAEKINQLVSNNLDANKITISSKKAPDSNKVHYFIRVNGQEFVELSATTRLPDTTKNLAQDTLQAANRMRRWLGNAKPLSPLENIATKTPAKAATSKKTAQQSQTQRKPVKKAARSSRVRASYKGIASYYSYDVSSNRRTANGERFNPHHMTAAHRSLPFGTKVRVTNTRNGRSVVVRINDRGPFIRGRIIDVSLGAAKRIGMVSSGIARVKVEVLQ